MAELPLILILPAVTIPSNEAIGASNLFRLVIFT
jgi:hypothetical protein